MDGVLFLALAFPGVFGRACCSSCCFTRPSIAAPGRSPLCARSPRLKQSSPANAAVHSVHQVHRVHLPPEPAPATPSRPVGIPLCFCVFAFPRFCVSRPPVLCLSPTVHSSPRRVACGDPQPATAVCAAACPGRAGMPVSAFLSRRAGIFAFARPAAMFHLHTAPRAVRAPVQENRPCLRTTVHSPQPPLAVRAGAGPAGGNAAHYRHRA